MFVMFSFCFVFGGRTHILKAGLCGPYHFGSLFLLDIHAPTPTPRHTHTPKQTYRPIHLLMCLACTLSCYRSCEGLPAPQVLS